MTSTEFCRIYLGYIQDLGFVFGLGLGTGLGYLALALALTALTLLTSLTSVVIVTLPTMDTRKPRQGKANQQTRMELILRLTLLEKLQTSESIERNSAGEIYAQ